MTTKEIPSTEWVSFLDAFSRMHRGWLVELEVLDPDLGDQLEARSAPLHGVVAELRSHPQAIEIMVGDLPECHVTHIIRNPVHVHLKESRSGAHETLRVESDDGVVTLLNFRVAARPEEVNGVHSAAELY